MSIRRWLFAFRTEERIRIRTLLLSVSSNHLPMRNIRSVVTTGIYYGTLRFYMGRRFVVLISSVCCCNPIFRVIEKRILLLYNTLASF